MENICEFLKTKGYKYAVMLKENLTEVWATKARKLKSGDFSDASRWDCWSLDENEMFGKTPGEIVEL